MAVAAPSSRQHSALFAYAERCQETVMMPAGRRRLPPAGSLSVAPSMKVVSACSAPDASYLASLAVGSLPVETARRTLRPRFASAHGRSYSRSLSRAAMAAREASFAGCRDRRCCALRARARALNRLQTIDSGHGFHASLVAALGSNCPIPRDESPRAAMAARQALLAGMP